MNLNDNLISEAIANSRHPGGKAWQQRVVTEMTRRKHQRLQRTFAVAASVAVAVTLTWFCFNHRSTADIYSDEYYASLPQSPLSIPDEINAILCDIEFSHCYFEPYEPLPQ